MTAPVTAVIGLGCGAFTGGYGAVDEGECVSTIQHALDIGSNLVDVADFYRKAGRAGHHRTTGRGLDRHARRHALRRSWKTDRH